MAFVTLLIVLALAGFGWWAWQNCSMKTPTSALRLALEGE
jgi:hypothetical protein